MGLLLPDQVLQRHAALVDLQQRVEHAELPGDFQTPGLQQRQHPQQHHHQRQHDLRSARRGALAHHRVLGVSSGSGSVLRVLKLVSITTDHFKMFFRHLNKSGQKKNVHKCFFRKKQLVKFRLVQNV